MLTRYSMVRGASASTLPHGIRQDTRKHTRHLLRPTEELVESVLGHPDDDPAWSEFAASYRALLDQRFATERAAFDDLAALAREHDVYLGCSCPTAKNPDLRRCHTVLALAFMAEHYPDLDVRFPAGTRRAKR